MASPKVFYLKNKEILAEIHKSKNTFSYYVDERYSHYDAIVRSLDEITPDFIKATKEQKAKKMTAQLKQEAKESGLKPSQIKIKNVDPETIKDEDLVWRLMTYDHIPLDPTRVKNPKTEADHRVKVNFPPFKHFVIEDGEFKEVGRSHWKDGLDNGQFCLDHGKITRTLALMFMKLVERYSQRGNWRGYTYNDEMRSQALLQLSQVGLQFDESRSENPNPFAYYTVTVTNAFTHILNTEKKNQNIRDDMLIMHGVSPSMTRQVENSLSQQALYNGEIPPAPVKKGRRGPAPRAKAVKEAAEVDKTESKKPE